MCALWNKVEVTMELWKCTDCATDSVVSLTVTVNNAYLVPLVKRHPVRPVRWLIRSDPCLFVPAPVNKTEKSFWWSETIMVLLIGWLFSVWLMLCWVWGNSRNSPGQMGSTPVLYGNGSLQLDKSLLFEINGKVRTCKSSLTPNHPLLQLTKTINNSK